MQYVKECLQLLYWIYFKPYTLKQHVREICPEITNPYVDNFFLRSAKAKANQDLQRYDDQVWWLTALLPVAGIFLFVSLALIFNNEPLSPIGVLKQFNLAAMPFSWFLLQLFIRATRRRLAKKTAVYLMLIALLAWFLLTKIGKKSIFFLPADSLLLLVVLIVTVVAFGLQISLTNGRSLKLAADVVFGLMLSLPSTLVMGGIIDTTLGTAVGLTTGAIFGVAMGVSEEIGLGITLGIIGGAIISVKFDVVFGTTVVAAFILGVLRFYFWLPELLWMFPLRFWPGNAAAKLPLVPPQFDQLIILPLPFLPSLIAQAYRENQAAARSTINYLISFTNQQKTASRAMLLIAAEEFRRCRTAGDIAAVRGQLDWLPADLTGKISLCLDLSQDTAAALEASTPYRQEERLRKVCAKIDQQRNALAAASAREATTLGAVLDQWQGILSTACRTLHETARRSGEIPQVYLPGPPLAPDSKLFKGRRDLFRQIESLLLSAQPPTLVMHGNRRSGKSSALLQLPKQMPSDILPLFVDCQGAATSVTLEGLARHLAEQLLASAKTTCRLTLPGPDKDELHRDPFAALLAWLDTVEQAAPGKTFLICLDEFERIDEIVTATGSRAPLNFLRHLIQHRRRWQLLFAGSHTPEELAPHWSDCLINTRSLRVSCLDKDDAVELICRPVPDFPDIWPKEAVEEVWQLTHGQPFLIQLLCQEAVEHLNRRKAKTVQPGDVAAILPAAFEHGHYYFDEFWRALTEDQRLLLAAVAKGEAVPPELHAAAATLLRKEVLVQENSGYTFKVPLIREWIAAKL